jgi:hypothetical protein
MSTNPIAGSGAAIPLPDFSSLMGTGLTSHMLLLNSVKIMTLYCIAYHRTQCISCSLLMLLSSLHCNIIIAKQLKTFSSLRMSLLVVTLSGLSLSVPDKQPTTGNILRMLSGPVILFHFVPEWFLIGYKQRQQPHLNRTTMTTPPCHSI